MIAYIVRSKIYKTDLTPEALTKFSTEALKRGGTIVKMLADMYTGSFSLNSMPEDLRGILCKEETTERIYSEASPIGARRAAVEHAQSLMEVINSTAEYKHALTYIQGDNSKSYGVFVYMSHAGREQLLLTFPFLGVSDMLLDAWAEELTVYEANGYDIGAGEAFTIYVPEARKVVRVLSDMAPYFSESHV